MQFCRFGAFQFYFHCWVLRTVLLHSKWGIAMACRSKGTPGLREGAKAKNGLAVHTTGFHSFSAWRSHPTSLLNDCSCFRRIFYHKYHSLIGGEGIPVLYCRKHLQLAQRQLTGSIKNWTCCNSKCSSGHEIYEATWQPARWVLCSHSYGLSCSQAM